MKHKIIQISLGILALLSLCFVTVEFVFPPKLEISFNGQVIRNSEVGITKGSLVKVKPTDSLGRVQLSVFDLGQDLIIMPIFKTEGTVEGAQINVNLGTHAVKLEGVRSGNH